ncbi:hypothetical protein ACLMJK_002442 [Lecanora helva]
MDRSPHADALDSEVPSDAGGSKHPTNDTENAGEDLNPFTSKIIEIVVGDGKAKLHAHAAFLCKSDKLKAQIEGQWADKDAIVSTDWDEETVVRLLEYLYTGTYSFPLVQDLLASDESDASPPLSYPNGCSTRHLSGQFDVDKCAPTKEPIKHSQIKISNLPRSLNDLEKSYELFDNAERRRRYQFLPSKEGSVGYIVQAKYEVTYLPTLMSHAKLYGLANYLILPDLQRLSFNHIREVIFWLKELPEDSRTVTEIVELTRYVYENTDGLENTEDPLRSFLATYIGLQPSWTRQGFDALIEEGGDIAVDISGKVRQRLEHVEKELDASLKKAKKNAASSKKRKRLETSD